MGVNRLGERAGHAARLGGVLTASVVLEQAPELGLLRVGALAAVLRAHLGARVLRRAAAGAGARAAGATSRGRLSAGERLLQVVQTAGLVAARRRALAAAEVLLHLVRRETRVGQQTVGERVLN